MKKVFVDLGAHLGESVLRFYKEVEDATTYKIYAFEPNPALIARLQQNLKGLSNVEVIPKAVSDKDEKTKLFLGSINNADGSTLVLSKKTGNINYDKPVEVFSIDFSRWLQSVTGNSDYIILKINIEGGEYALMENMIQSGVLNRISQIHLILHAHKIGDSVFKATATEITSRFLSACQDLGVPVVVTNDGHKKFNA